MMGWFHDGMGMGGWLVLASSVVAFWAIVVFAVVAIFRAGNVRRSGPVGGDDPLDILDRRFARGEIDESEYNARVNLLRSSPR